MSGQAPGSAPEQRRRRMLHRRRRTVLVASTLLVTAGGVALVTAFDPQGVAPSATVSPLRSSPSPPARPTPPPRAAPASPAATAGTVSLAAVGDIGLGNTPVLPPHPQSYLSPVRAALAAPIVLGNLEGTLTDAASSPKCAAGARGCYAFRVPPSYAGLLRAAGFTVLSSANNHAHDFGARGLADTEAALRRAGITDTGRPGQVSVVREGGTRVAFVAFAPYPNANDLLDLDAARRLVGAARARADVVVVYMHAGAEGAAASHVTGRDERYLGEDRGNPRAFAHAVVDAGADLVVGSGPHVLRGMEYYRGHLIAYSLANFAGYRDFATGGDLRLSGILHVTLDHAGRLAAGRFTSLALDGDGRPSVDPSHAAARFVNRLSAADFGAAAATVGRTGALSPPPFR